ncbi:unnamed protein product, partial [Trichogramma brassicae]
KHLKRWRDVGERGTRRSRANGQTRQRFQERDSCTCGTTTCRACVRFFAFVGMTHKITCRA